jgi:hypothetical protein
MVATVPHDTGVRDPLGFQQYGHDGRLQEPAIALAKIDLFVYDREIVQDGNIQLSDKPGPGFEVDKDFASRYLMEGEFLWA